MLQRDPNCLRQLQTDHGVARFAAFPRSRHNPLVRRVVHGYQIFRWNGHLHFDSVLDWRNSLHQCDFVAALQSEQYLWQERINAKRALPPPPGAKKEETRAQSHFEIDSTNSIQNWVIFPGFEAVSDWFPGNVVFMVDHAVVDVGLIIFWLGIYSCVQTVPKICP